jgi:hypothetical protein
VGRSPGAPEPRSPGAPEPRAGRVGARAAGAGKPGGGVAGAGCGLRGEEARRDPAAAGGTGLAVGA